MSGFLAYCSAALALASAAAAFVGLPSIASILLAIIASAAAFASGVAGSARRAEPAPASTDRPRPTAAALSINRDGSAAARPEPAAAPAQASSDEPAARAAPSVAPAPAPIEAPGPDRQSIARSLVKLRVADAVLSKVPKETEEAAFALMERLIALRNQSAEASKAASTADGDLATSNSITTLADDAKATIARVRAALANMRKHDKSAAQGLQTLGKELSGGIALLAEIGEITERSRLIAFNMAIEAARIGSQGNGFKVIVNELRTLNDQTAEFSKRVSELLGRFKKFNESLVEKSVSDSALVAEEVEKGILDEEKAIESLLSISHACVDLSGDIEQVVASMNRDLDGILESLQFQDITRQMVEGVQSIVSEVRDEMSRAVESTDGAPAAAPGAAYMQELRIRLLSLAHTRGEKEAIQEVMK